MDPNIWGPHAWHFLHTITLFYPINPTPKQKKTYKLFFHNLADVLPCSHCSSNYKFHLKQLPIDDFLHNRQTLVSWLVKIHNLTNQNLKKKQSFTLEQFTKLYKSLYSKPPHSCFIYFNIFIYILLTIFILFTIYIIFYNQIKKYFYIFLNKIYNIQTIY